MSVVDWIALVLLWGASISRIRSARHSFEQRMLWAAFTALALSRVASAAPVVAWMDTTTGTELVTLLRHVTGLVSAACLLAYVEAITRRDRPSRGRWVWPTALSVIVLLTVMFLLRGGRIYWADGATGPGETAIQGRIYLAAFDAWLMTCGCAAAWMFAQHARFAPPLLRFGLILSTIGNLAGVVNRGHVMVVNVAHLINPATTWREIPALHKATFLACIVLITAGTSIPAWRAGTTRLRERAELRELQPLWEAIIRQYPTVSLGMKGSLQTRLVRRVVEIQDGMLNLTSVHEPPENDDPAEVARWIADALKAARASQEPGVPTGRIPGPDLTGEEDNTGKVQREAAWLRQVAAQFKKINTERAAQLAP
ncbi:MAB_1171c family putative transporter [Nonomuraea sp. NPDC026600]|uniref:MAB_1171c family putative transporter n=1 Tax=Nonomuraea sp. NPDC026600 TaxID=3155363 RepID=UPI0033CA93FF